ncbi:MAG: hypothetical protein ACK4KV_18995 [Rhodocyclaceae bacterium]
MTRQTRNTKADQASERAEDVAEAPAAPDGIRGTHTGERDAAAADGVLSSAAGAVPPSFVGDPYWGRGGRYIVGGDGVRRPAGNQE